MSAFQGEPVWGRAYIVHDEAETVIRLDWDGKARNRLLTAYPWTQENAPKPRLDFRPNDRAFGDEQRLPSSHSEGVSKNIDELFIKDKAFFQDQPQGPRGRMEMLAVTR